ncbi:MAG: hypothetical protein A4E40_01120 [Methanoregulaceae archaeon PtaU1.Bin059]|nr:MAG: hypothetical protein A4E40_01120 [Methanoregulaceae archaeon PtaU1.Bin059]
MLMHWDFIAFPGNFGIDRGRVSDAALFIPYSRGRQDGVRKPCFLIICNVVDIV